MTGVAIYFYNIPGAMLRVLNCFTRRGLVLEAVCAAPAGNRHCARVLVDAQPITIEQTVRELNSTVGVDSVQVLDGQETEQIANWRLPEPESQPD